MSIWDIITQSGQELLKYAAGRLQFRLPTEPVPEHWHDILASRVPLARGLSTAETDRLLRVARLLLSEVAVEGCGGLAVNEEMRVTIATNAAMLIYRLPYPRFTKLVRILLYPEVFVPKKAASRHDVIVKDSDPALGQAWVDGMVVLSWEAIEHDAADHPSSGNVVIHEMAHILDAEDGRFDGTPVLDDRSQSAAWAAVLTREFAHQRDAVDAGREPPLDEYAATNPGEFFAVATEAFFCSPARLRDRLPELYEQLQLFYGGGLGHANDAPPHHS